MADKTSSLEGLVNLVGETRQRTGSDKTAFNTALGTLQVLRENTTGATKLDFRRRGRKGTPKLRVERRVCHKKGRRRARRELQ